MAPIGVDELSPFPNAQDRHDVYPFIDPATHFTAQTFRDQVVIVTGASRGIGLTTALFYARAGAHLVLTSRHLSTLETSKTAVLAAVPGAHVLLGPGDVADPAAAAAVVQSAVAAFGKVDILVANAGMLSPIGKQTHEQDLLQYWQVQEVNVRGVLNFIHAALPELLKTKGQIVITASAIAHLRIVPAAAYCLSKHTVNRLAEFLSLEYPDIKTYPVHPGVVDTQIARDAGGLLTPIDAPELAAATSLWLTARNAEWLSGRFFSATWDLEEVVKHKDEIVRDNLLVTKLAGPKASK
ncbi:NAD-P-binding protein [Amylostereum chailletii]|nr:NAD-P-binding protein [Amylostereum chailletii]